MNLKYFIMQSMSASLYNHFFYYYLHLMHGIIPKRLNLHNPSTFNEKTIWLKMNQRYPDATIMADKIQVKDFVAHKIGKQYLIPLIDVFDDVDRIDFKRLPDAFVLKANHGSGWNIICRNKDQLDITKIKRQLKQWLNINYTRVGKEYQYSDIKPKILCETYFENSAENPLIDYKIFCFSGRPVFIQVDLDRFTNHTRNFYNLNWELEPFTTCYPFGEKQLAKPESLNEMLAIAKILSQGTIFARIDLYNYMGKVYFGEITFHHGGGFEPFMPSRYDHILGEYIVLPSHDKSTRYKSESKRLLCE